MKHGGAAWDDLVLEERELFELLLEKEGLDFGQLPIAKRPEKDWAPLSSTQERLWRLGQRYRRLPFGNVPIVLRLTGSFRVAAAQFAFDELVRRHEVLRTTFAEQGGRVVQRIHPARPVRFVKFDLRALPQGERWGAAERIFHEQLWAPFDYERDFLFRVSWIHLGESECCLALIVHHLITEGWGMRVLLQEFSRLYAAWGNPRAMALPPLAIQYGDYAAWEHERLGLADLAVQQKYWAQQISGAATPRLPGGARTESGVDPASSAIRMSIDRELTSDLRRLSRDHGVTLFETLSAMLGVFFHDDTAPADLAVGTTIACRDRPETERLIGNFGNNLFLRIKFENDPPFIELLGRVRDSSIEARANAAVPFERMFAAEAEKSGVGAADFEFMFVMRDGRLAEHLQLPGVEVREAPLESGLLAVDLKLDLADGPDEITGVIEFRRARFTSEMVERMAGELLVLIQNAVANPTWPVSALANSRRCEEAGQMEVPSL